MQWVWFGVVLCAVTHLLLRNLLHGRFGRALLSLQADEIASSSVGVRVYRAKVMAFVVAAVTCGIAGALVAQQNQYINSDFITFHLSIFILLLVLFGGAGSMYGPLVGAVLLTADRRAAGALAVGAALPLRLPAAVRAVRDAGRRGRAVREVVQAAEPRQPAPAPAQVKPLTRIGPDGEGELLAVQGVSKSYGGVKPAQDVSFRLQRGHIHALIGPNGAGKSTMINMLTGVVDPDAGSIEFLGQDIVGQPVHAICCLGMGRTFQNLRLFADLSVLDNVMLGRHSRMKNGFFASLLALAGRDEAGARHARTRAAAARTRRPRAPGAPAGRQPAVRPAAPRGTGARAGHRAATAAARRARRRPQPAGDRRARPTAGAHRQVRREHPDGGAPHGPGDVDLRPRDRARLRHQDRRGQARRGAGNPRVVEAYLGVDDERSRRGAEPEGPNHVETRISQGRPTARSRPSRA